jgi:hypothetical protein
MLAVHFSDDFYPWRQQERVMDQEHEKQLKQVKGSKILGKCSYTLKLTRDHAATCAIPALIAQFNLLEPNNIIS